MAPHVIVEQVCVDSIAHIRDTYRTGPLKSRLAKYHARVDDAFLGWADIWLEPEFRNWSIEGLVASVQAAHAADPGYGRRVRYCWTSSTASRLGAHAHTQRLVLDRCGHSPHRDQEAAVIDAIVAFAKDVRRGVRQINGQKGERA